MALQLGSFLESYGAARSKRKTIEAHAAEQERARQAEIEKEKSKRSWEIESYDIKKGIDEGITKRTEVRDLKTKIAEEGRANIQSESVASTLFTRQLLIKDRAQIFSDLANMAKTEGGISSSLQQSLLRAKILNPFTLKIMVETGADIYTGTVTEKSDTDFKEFTKNVNSGSVKFLSGDLEMFTAQYGKAFKKLNPNKDITKYYTTLKDQISKNLIKSNGNRLKLGSGQVSKELPSKEKVAFPAPFKYEPTQKANERHEAHKMYTRSIATRMATLHRNKQIDLNSDIGYEFLANLMIPILDVRNTILSQKKDNPVPPKKNWQDLQGVKDSTILQAILNKRKEESVSSNKKSVSGKVIATTPHKAALDKQSNVPSTTISNTSTIPAKPVSPLNDQQVLLKPNSTAQKDIEHSFFVKAKPDFNDPDIQFYNKHINSFKDEHTQGYFIADHARITEALVKAHPAAIKLSPTDKFEYYTTGAGKSQGKAYFTSVIAKKFQTYGLNSDDNTERFALRSDNDFHKALYQLEKIDDTFDGSAALAESLFKTFKTHTFDPSIDSEDNPNTPIKRTYMYHKKGENGEITERDTTMKSLNKSIEKGEEVLTSLDKIIGDINNAPNTVGLAANVQAKVIDWFTVGVQLKDDLLSLIGKDNKKSPVDRGLTPNNNTVLNKFLKKTEDAQKELIARKTKGGFTEKEYLLASVQLSNKIRLAYMLSSQLQGGGEGGGRTISDADFKYALEAVWGNTSKTISARLGTLRTSIASKLKRARLYRKYDETGLAIKINDFLMHTDSDPEKRGYAGYRDARIKEERINSLVSLANEEKQDSQNKGGNNTGTGESPYLSRLFDAAPAIQPIFKNMRQANLMDYSKKLKQLSDNYIKKNQVIISLADELEGVQDIPKYLAEKYEGEEEYRNQMDIIRTNISNSLFKGQGGEANSLFRFYKGKTYLNTNDKESNFGSGYVLFGPESIRRDENTQPAINKLLDVLILNSLQTLTANQ